MGDWSEHPNEGDPESVKARWLKGENHGAEDVHPKYSNQFQMPKQPESGFPETMGPYHGKTVDH